MAHFRLFIIFTFISFVCDCTSAQERGFSQGGELFGQEFLQRDAYVAPSFPVSVQPNLPQKGKTGLVDRVINYFKESNKEHHAKNFDMSFIGGPYYSSDTKLGIGLVAAGIYRTDPNDTILPPSEMSLYLKATTSMFFQLGLRGNHIRPGDRQRFIYDLNLASIDTKFWGIGYNNNINDNNESNYKYINSQLRASYVWRLSSKFYAGPMVTFDYINASDLHNEWLWEGQRERTFNLGVGITVQYDSRDFLSNAYHGIYLRLDQLFLPRKMFNKSAFSMTELRVSNYHPLWKNAIFASNFHTRITYGNTPWGLLSTLGGSDNMRGYYEGRFRDKCEFDLCAELRQHIYRRHGIVVWGGCGMVFPNFKSMSWRKLLPNYGIGYRWEFKKRVNVRLDYGFGRHQSGLIFSINEAF